MRAAAFDQLLQHAQLPSSLSNTRNALFVHTRFVRHHLYGTKIILNDRHTHEHSSNSSCKQLTLTVVEVIRNVCCL